MMLSNFFHWSARWTLAFLLALVAIFAWKWAVGTLRLRADELPALVLWVLVPPFAGGIVCGAFMALVLPPSLRQAARTADGLWETRDRFVSALDFLARKEPSDVQRLALAECAAFAEKGKREVAVAAPAELRWTVVPLMMIALLSWDSLSHESARQALVANATRETAGTIQQLESLATRLDKKSEDQARKLAEHLRKSAEQLRAEAKEGRDGEKAALRELSMLEQLVKEMRQQHAATPEELKALADALASNDQTKAAAADIQRGDFGEAAKKLEAAANNPEVAAQAERDLRRAIEHLAQQKEQLSKQLEQLRDNARESGSGERQQLMQQLAQALNELQKQGKVGKAKDGKAQPQQSKGGGKEMTDDDLKRMLGALQNLKNNEGTPSGDGEPQPDENGGDGEVRMSNFSGNKPGTTAPGSDENGEQAPTGQTSDKDETGTTKDPFGAQGTAAKTGKDEQSGSRLGEGESLSAMIPSAPGADEKSKRRYRELYRAAAADAEDAVVQESIPLGARFLIKRYFESIRPKER